jgi:large subunit ribosomal protein L16
MFIPKKTKFKKQQKGRSFKKISINKTCAINILKKSNKITLLALSAGRISSKHLVTCKQTINKVIKKYGTLFIPTFAHTPISKKPAEIRMGKGKGAVNEWVAKIKPGKILFEILVTQKPLGIKALKSVQNKLPINTKIII